MQIGLVIGTLVSSRKEGKLDGHRILVVRYLDEKMNAGNKTAACIDTVNAGAGEVVLMCASSSARMTKSTKEVATDNTIIAIVDSIYCGNKYLYNKELKS